MNLPSSPFKGLAHFDESEHDRRLFFGRERESELVAANLMASRLTVLYGPSGVGKSSLVRAGVVQRLRTLVPTMGGDAAEPEVVIVDRWRDDPIAAVVAAAHACRLPTRGRSAARRGRGRRALPRPRPDGGVPAVPRSRRRPACGRAGGRAHPQRLVHVLLGIRDDALADLDSLKRRVPGVFGNVLRLDHLTRAAARSAVHGPLRVYAELGGPEVSAEEELVEAVLDEVAAGSIQQHLSGRGLVDEGRSERRVEAPFLQLVLERLWEVERGRGSSILNAATLTELGEPDGSSRSIWVTRSPVSTTRSETSSRDSSTTSSRRPEPRSRMRSTTWHGTATSTRHRSGPCWAPSRPPGSCAGCPAGAAGRRATRSSTTCSLPQSSPGATGTRPTGLSQSSGRARDVAIGAWPWSPCSPWWRSPGRSPSPRGPCRNAQRLGSRRIARSRELAALALTELGNDPERSLVFAAEAARLDRSSGPSRCSCARWPPRVRAVVAAPGPVESVQLAGRVVVGVAGEEALVADPSLARAGAAPPPARCTACTATRCSSRRPPG